MPGCVADASAVVLLVLDGLGWEAIQTHRERLPVLSRLDGGPITTVVPSTTSAALTSITTGTAPAEHGMVGYRMLVRAGVLDVLRWKMPDGTGGPPPESVAPVRPFFGLPVPVVTRQQFQRGGFTAAHMRGARFFGWRVTSVLVMRCLHLVQEGEHFVFAYYDGVDSVAHTYGLHDTFFPAELAWVDRLVGELLAALPPSAALVVTSDHGQVHLETQLTLAPISGLIDCFAGDVRFRFLHARRGAAGELHGAANECFGEQAWVLSRDQLVDEGWLGPKPPATDVLERLGDVVLAAREPVGFMDPTHPRESTMLSGHGSVTSAEMLVPLLAGRGTGH